MVTALLRIILTAFQFLTRSAVLELIGFVLLVVAIAAIAGAWWGVLTAGCGLLLKAFEKDMRAGGDE